MKFLATSDFHLSKKKPRCRMDPNWEQTQRNNLNQIAQESASRKCPVIVAGDVFNSSVVPEEIINLFLEFCHVMNQDVMLIAGNHDLPEHSMNKINKSSIGILFNVIAMGTTKLVPLDKYRKEISYANFGEEITNPGKDILIIHRLVFPNTLSIPPNSEAMTAKELLAEYPDYKYIITGDCHIPFHYEKKGRHVINPGHLNIQKVNELDPPVIYFVDTDNDIVEEIPIQDDIELVTDVYVRNEEERADRVEAFLEKLESKEEVSLSFEDNIEEDLVLNKDNLDKPTVKLIRYLMEGNNDQFQV